MSHPVSLLFTVGECATLVGLFVGVMMFARYREWKNVGR